MITKNIPTYHCSYCSKYYIHKGYAARHEKACRNNPNNKHACFDFCEHLERKLIGYCGNTEFTCTKLNKKLFSYKAENNIHTKDRKEVFEGCERMPLTCPHHSYRVPARLQEKWDEMY